jgi:hypothetical protein
MIEYRLADPLPPNEHWPAVTHPRSNVTPARPAARARPVPPTRAATPGRTPSCPGCSPHSRGRPRARPRPAPSWPRTRGARPGCRAASRGTRRYTITTARRAAGRAGSRAPPGRAGRTAACGTSPPGRPRPGRGRRPGRRPASRAGTARPVEAGRGQHVLGRRARRGQVGHAHLHVDIRLGLQTGHGGRADVVVGPGAVVEPAVAPAGPQPAQQARRRDGPRGVVAGQHGRTSRRALHPGQSPRERARPAGRPPEAAGRPPCLRLRKWHSPGGRAGHGTSRAILEM